jgi:hypothetical protein
MQCISTQSGSSGRFGDPPGSNTHDHGPLASRRRFRRVDYTGRLFRDRKAAISAEVAGIPERRGGTVESWHASLEKLSMGRLLGRFFAASRARLRKVAARLGVHHLANLGGCPRGRPPDIAVSLFELELATSRESSLWSRISPGDRALPDPDFRLPRILSSRPSCRPPSPSRRVGLVRVFGRAATIIVFRMPVLSVRLPTMMRG